MKKIIFLLSTLSLASSISLAKENIPTVEESKIFEKNPILKVTNIGQYLEIDNTSGAEDIGENVHFANYVGLAYGDNWTFDFMARKTWSMDTDDGVHSKNHRIDLDAWRNFENFSLGFRFRNEEDFDRYYLRTKYQYGLFSGWIDGAYQSNNGAIDSEDAYYLETMPVTLTIGPVTLGYYFEADTWSVNTIDDKTSIDKAGFKHDYRQQLRLSSPIYKGDKLNIGFEYRWQFDTDTEYDMKYRTEGYDEIKNNHIFILSAGYDITENLNINGYYQYEIRDYDRKGDNNPAHNDDYYGEFFIGWNYKF
ncbi:hypothetical protein [Fusobacterium sp.]|uniref:hypothetical protein n=1 Tax=Fusobacterium sp. TaxID=68766 RepID=UPI0026309A17|nr:hypothetical protein [Fusobacterium sp.]